jgi:type VI protein secretion system component Hcp
MNVTGIRLVRSLIAAVLAAAVVSALALQPGGTLAAPSSVRPPTSLADIELAGTNAQDIFFLVSGFTGETNDNQYANMSTATGVTSAIVRTSSSSGGRSGRSAPEPIIVTKVLDAYTTQLTNAISTGHVLQMVHLYFRKPGDTPFTFLTYELSDVVVTRDGLEGGTNAAPVETVRLMPAKVKLIYTPQNSDGAGSTFVYCWNFVTNVNCANT